MGTQKPSTQKFGKGVKLTPYSRGNKVRIDLERQRLAENANKAKTEREIMKIYKQHQQRRAAEAQMYGRARKKHFFDYAAFNSRPVYIPQPGAPGFNSF